MTVWDASAGTGNLIRMRPFSSLIATTLYAHDLDHLPDGQAHIQHPIDFLFSMSIPDDIANCLKRSKAVLFLNNPPYKTVNEQEFRGRVRRAAGHTNTAVKQAMKAAGLSRAGDQLSVQFMYKITELSHSLMKMTIPSRRDQSGCDHHRDHVDEIIMGIFIPANILTGPVYDKFRRYFLDSWSYMSGFMIPAREFVGVRGIFSIAFTIWRYQHPVADDSTRPTDTAPGSVPIPSLAIEFDLKLLTSETVSGPISDIGRMRLHQARHDQRLNLWARSRTPRTALIDHVPLTSALVVQAQCRYAVLERMPSDAIGYLHSNGNSVQHNDQLVGLYSSAFAAGHGIVVRPDNFQRACVVFTARRLVRRTWSNWLLEYRWPKATTGAGFRRWACDAVVLALFDTKANQSSLRYPHVVLNQWFWMSRDQIRSFATPLVGSDLAADQSESDRFVFGWLKRHRSDLGAEAERLLMFAEETVTTSMALREANEFETGAWDSGWYQIRKLIAAHPGPSADRFHRIYSELRADLASRLFYQLDEFGFLPLCLSR